MQPEEFPHFESQIPIANDNNIPEIDLLVNEDAVKVEVKHPPHEQKHQRREKNEGKVGNDDRRSAQ
jgi:hypothetical protein